MEVKIIRGSKRKIKVAWRSIKIISQNHRKIEVTWEKINLEDLPFLCLYPFIYKSLAIASRLIE